MKFLIFTDLDGTLLDHDTYSHQPAKVSLAALQQRAIPVVLSTSKTTAEVLHLQAQLNIHAPFIVENGSAVAIPGDDARFNRTKTVQSGEVTTHCFGATRSLIQQRLAQIRQQSNYDYLAFSALSTAQIAAATGLDADSAARAGAREYSEPLIWRDSDAQLAQFAQALQAQKLRCIKGGRFLHVLGAHADKGRAMNWIKARYNNSAAITTVALGDSENDIGMLNNADIAVRIRSRHHAYPQAQGRSQTLSTTAYGPAGWAEAMQIILEQF